MDELSKYDLDDFSLAKGGPFFRLLVSSGLMRPDFSPMHRRAILFALTAWLPLLVFTAISGTATGETVSMPFLYDFMSLVRFLLAIPLILAADSVIDHSVTPVMQHFAGSGLLAEKAKPRFLQISRQLSNWRNSVLSEGMILLFVIFSTAFLRPYFSATASTWQYMVSPSGATCTLAGWWYIIVSIPIFQFLMYRWLWRYGLWCWYLFRISRLDMQLVPTHPDRAAGLSILGITQAKFGIIIFVFSAIISSYFAQEVVYGGASLLEYKMLILGYILLILIIFLGPLFVFYIKLFEVKEKGLLEYSALANEYVQSFDRKWIRRELSGSEPLIGSADIQSLADLGNSFANIREMMAVPADFKTTILPIFISAVIPFLPLTLTVFPLEEILRKLVGILL